MDYKRNNKLNIGHNVTEAFDFHDVVRLLLMKQLRRKNQDVRYPLYTEFDPLKPNSDYPDIWMKIKKDIYVWELQSKMTPAWTKQIIKKYEEVNLIIVPLEEIKKEWLTKKGDPIKELNKLLEDYVL